MKKIKILASIFAGGLTVASFAFIKANQNKHSSASTTAEVKEQIEDVINQHEQAHAEKLYSDAYNKSILTTHAVAIQPTLVEYSEETFDILPAINGFNYKFKKNSLVNPPIKGMEPKGKIYVIDPTQEVNLTTDAGSVIHIPANAFKTEDGKTVTEKVEVFYCEYNDPFDFVTSGIPMTYDSGGQVNHFESAGMFDIQAKSEGEDLVLAKDKNIKIDVASTNSDTDFNFYELNEKAGDWVNQTNSLTPSFPRIGLALFDNTPFSDRYTNLNYFTDYSRGPRRVSFRGNKIPNTKLMQGVTTVRGTRSSKKMVHMRSSFRIKRMPRLKGDSADVVRFKIEPRSTRKRKYSNPAHLRDFVNKTWIFKGDLSRFEFWMELARAKRCHDVRIIYEEGNDNFTFELKSSAGFVQIDAYTFNDNPETVSDAKVYASVKKFSRSYNKYMTKLDKLQEEYDSALSIRSKQNEMAAESYDISPNDEGYQLVSRTVTLTNLGLYNCDRIMLMKNPKNVLAKFKVEGTDEILEPKVSYVIDEKTNGMFSYGGNVITIDPNYTKCIVLVLGNGRVAYVKGKDVKSGYSGPNSDFVAKIATSKTREGLKEELGL